MNPVSPRSGNLYNTNSSLLRQGTVPKLYRLAGSIVAPVIALASPHQVNAQALVNTLPKVSEHAVSTQIDAVHLNKDPKPPRLDDVHIVKPPKAKQHYPWANVNHPAETPKRKSDYPFQITPHNQ